MTRTAIGQDGKKHAMQAPSGFAKPAAPMIAKRLIAAAVVLCAGLALGSCGGVSEDGFSAYVADHWPHWAGGMPSDVPPRPGAPGYSEFIAHGQADQATGANAAAVPVKPVFQTAAPAARAAPVAQVAPTAQAAPQAASDDSSVVQGGLY